MYADRRVTGYPRHLQKRPWDWNLRVPPQVRNCVVFLGYEENGEPKIGGTGFIIEVSSTRYPSQFVWSYLITARHVAECILRRERHFVRLNSFHKATEVWSDASWEWDLHEDKNVDLAVLPWSDKRQITHQLTAIPIDELLLREYRNSQSPNAVGSGIGIGDEVFTVGLFPKISGREKNEPIVRTGTIAMVPDETVQSEVGKDDLGNPVYGDVDAYLIEARSVGGTSGSPVWVSETLLIEHNESCSLLQEGSWFLAQGPLHLLGMVTGHWTVPWDRNSDLELNAGISVVVKAKTIHKRLMSEKYVAQRTACENAVLSNTAAKMDSED